jgi:hypothetical protein
MGLGQLVDQKGLYKVIEEDPSWRPVVQKGLQQKLTEAENELRHLQAYLQRTGAFARSASFGQQGTADRMTAEHRALEGWILSLVETYVTLTGVLSLADRQARFARLRAYIEGTILRSTSPHAAVAQTGEQIQETVRALLKL